MKVRFLFLLCLSSLLEANAQTTSPTTTPQVVDSMAYYSNTKKPAISDPALTEYAATIQADGKVMVIQSNVPGKSNQYRLYQYQLDASKKWVNPASLDSINAIADSTSLIGGPNISFDGNTMYFFRNNDIYYSERQRHGWGRPITLGAPINSREYEGFPSISADGRTLYFVGRNEVGPRSKELKKKNVFCTSIYKSIKEKDGTWGEPELLPYPINQDCEKAPRIMADGRTLIFSSNRPGGKGGFDMYQTRLTDLDTWDSPVPLSYVNTELDDQSPSISAEGDLMYYTYNGKDIYSVVIPHSLRQFKNNILQGYVTDQDTKAGLGVDIIVSDAFTSEEVMHLQNNPDDGRYTVVLPVGGSFNIEFRRDNYSSFIYAMDLTKVTQYRELDQNIELFRTVKLTLHVNDKENFDPLAANVKVRVKGERSFTHDLKTNPKTGQIVFELPLGAEYETMVSCPNFKDEIGDFHTTGLIIYRDFERFIELVPEKKNIMINVADIKNNSKVNSKVVIKNKSRDEVIEVTGNQMVALRAGDRYEIEVASDNGYAFNSQTLDLKDGAKSEIEFKVLKLEPNAKLPLRDINFESNSAILTDISFEELNRVVTMLQENPTLTVEIAAHTDDKGSDNYNLVLSQKRAQSVVDFLKQKNISAKRFVAQGYGEKEFKVPNTTEDNRQQNRRVELKVKSI
jgi:outer membrane protein OmpA-like peptidoglycan-associated protein